MTAEPKNNTLSSISVALRQLQPLLNQITQAGSLAELAEAIFQVARTSVDFKTTGIYFINPETGKLELLSVVGFSEEEKKDAEATAMSRHPGWVIRNKKTYIANSEPQETAFQKRLGIRSRLYAPVLFKGDCVGTIGVASSESDMFNEDHVAFVEFLCQIAAVAYENIIHVIELKASRDRLDHAIKALKFGIWDWEIRSDTLLWDDYMYTLYEVDKEEFTGAYDAFGKTLHPEDADRVKKEIEACIARKQDFRSEFRVVGRNKTEKVIAANGRIVLSSSGDPLRLVGANWDVTHEKENEMLLLQASKMSSLGEMAAGIAHEINNPLAIIQGKSSLIASCVDGPEVDRPRVKKLSADIDRTVMRVVRIIKGLRAFSREGSRDAFELKSVAVLLEETLSFCSERFKGNGVKLIVDSVEPELTMECQPPQISQVILNLLNNSFDAVQVLPEKWVRLEVRDLGASIEISVTDSGSGIPEAIRAKILQPFFTTKEVGKGTGLGLSISAGIMKSQGGRLSLDEASAHTRFVIVMPKKKLIGPA
jgi:signal transduction histidine kinase